MINNGGPRVYLVILQYVPRYIGFVCCVMMLYVFLCRSVCLCVSFCTGHFVMVPLNLTYLHCLQKKLFKNLFNLY